MKRSWLIGGAIVLALWTALCVVVVLAIVNTKGQASYAKGQAHTAITRQAQTNQILVRSCQDNGNPLRLAVQQMLKDQIKQSHSGAVKKLGIPPHQLHRLIQRANKRRRQEIRQIQPVDCAALYH